MLNNAQTPQVATDTEAAVAAQFPQNRWAGSGMDYDGAGNQKAGGTGRSFVFDAENRIASGVVNGVAVSYSYDADGRRVKKVDGYGTTIYVYAANGDLVAEYFAAANGVTQPASAVGTRYLLTDHLGSTRMETDAAMTDVRLFDYGPFGEDLTQGVNGRGAAYPVPANLIVPDKVTQRFTGNERDAETGLDYFGARYLSGAQGRFTSADAPFADQHVEDPQSWNLYSYGGNNPLRFTDPDGRRKAPVGLVADALETTSAVASNGIRVLAGFLTGFFAIEASAGGNNEDQIVDALNEEGRKNDAEKAEEKEPEASADGAGARKGGGKGGGKSGKKNVHGNTVGDQPAELYRRTDKDGNFLKWGISNNAATRYTKKQLDGGAVRVVESGTRKEMIQRERDLVEKSPGPLNKEKWAGKQQGK